MYSFVYFRIYKFGWLAVRCPVCLHKDNCMRTVPEIVSAGCFATEKESWMSSRTGTITRALLWPAL